MKRKNFETELYKNFNKESEAIILHARFASEWSVGESYKETIGVFFSEEDVKLAKDLYEQDIKRRKRNKDNTLGNFSDFVIERTDAFKSVN